MKEQFKSQIKILFLTDIHHRKDNVEKLKIWHSKHKIDFDLCLIGGDTANCKHRVKTHNEENELVKSNQLLRQIQQFFEIKMWFIPGNHDPLVYFNPQYHISQNIQNLHEKTIEVQQNLQIIGFGGSVPSYEDKQRKIKGKCKGYPFTNDSLAEYMQQKNPFTQNVSQKQKIYLTHVGPFDYQTSIDRSHSQKIQYQGAVYFNQLVHHKNLILYLHGHVHRASKFVKVNQIPLINPGALRDKRFGYVVLSKDQVDKKWCLQSSHFVELN